MRVLSEPMLTHRCGVPQGRPPLRSDTIGRCRICGGRPPCFCRWRGNSRTCPGRGPAASSCHPHLQKETVEATTGSECDHVLYENIFYYLYIISWWDEHEQRL